MKKTISLLLALVLCLSLCACDTLSGAEKAVIGAWIMDGEYDVFVFSEDGKVVVRETEEYDWWYDKDAGRYCISFYGLTYTFVIEENEKARKKVWDLMLQDAWFNGLGDGKSFGLLNAPGVTVDTTLITAKLASMTDAQFDTFLASAPNAFAQNAAYTLAFNYPEELKAIYVSAEKEKQFNDEINEED